MKILVIDGQGGKIGRTIVAQLAARDLDWEILAVGTNSMATLAMHKAGAQQSATGENPVVVSAARADVIIGPMGIIAANALMGEITPRIAMAVSEAAAVKILIPMNRCGIMVAGTPELTITEFIDKAVDTAAAMFRAEKNQ